MYSLKQRAAALDTQTDGSSVSEDVARLIQVLSEIVSLGTETIFDVPKLRPLEADQQMAECRLLERLGSAVPEITTGPLSREAQYWISAEKPHHLPPNIPNLAEEHFRSAMEAPRTYSTKPFWFGLYTSTDFMGTQGMWRTYLDVYEGSAVPPPIWHIWRLTARPDAEVLEIATAVDWAAFVERFPAKADGLVYPDWQASARQYDAIHIMIRAVAAIQGLCFYVSAGITAPAYWDVETTFWLRWRFKSVQLCEIAVGP